MEQNYITEISCVRKLLIISKLLITYYYRSNSLGGLFGMAIKGNIYHFFLYCIIDQNDFLKEIKMCLHELSIVDDTLEALSAKKEYQWLRKWIIRIIIGWIVYIFFQIAESFYVMFLRGFDINFSHIPIVFLIYYPEFVNISYALISGTIIGYSICKHLSTS